MRMDWLIDWREGREYDMMIERSDSFIRSFTDEKGSVSQRDGHAGNAACDTILESFRSFRSIIATQFWNLQAATDRQKSQAQYWLGFESPVRQGIFLAESTSSADSLKCWQPLFGHMKILQTLVWIGSAAIVVAVPYPDRATRISHK